MSQTSSRKTARTRRLQYAEGGLDRAALRREDPDHFERALSAPDTELVAVWRDRSHVARPSADAAPAAQRISTSLRERADELVFLGEQSGRALFAADLSSLSETEALALAGGEFVDLRRVGPTLSAGDAALLAYARGMLYWHRNHRYCGRCGSPTESRRAGHLRVCTDAGCARPSFPRTDPAMIVLVLHPDEPKCLMGRARKWPRRAYSTLAGFVEPGESFEATVRREVLEESGIEVGQVDYIASQPWPFPSSVMIGFHAHAESTRIECHDEELVDARWFTLDEVRSAGEWDDEDAALCLPRHDSIARFLIEHWLDRAG